MNKGKIALLILVAVVLFAAISSAIYFKSGYLGEQDKCGLVVLKVPEEKPLVEPLIGHPKYLLSECKREGIWIVSRPDLGECLEKGNHFNFSIRNMGDGRIDYDDLKLTAAPNGSIANHTYIFMVCTTEKYDRFAQAVYKEGEELIFFSLLLDPGEQWGFTVYVDVGNMSGNGVIYDNYICIMGEKVYEFGISMPSGNIDNTGKPNIYAKDDTISISEAHEKGRIEVYLENKNDYDVYVDDCIVTAHINDSIATYTNVTVTRPYKVFPIPGTITCFIHKGRPLRMGFYEMWGIRKIPPHALWVIAFDVSVSSPHVLPDEYLDNYIMIGDKRIDFHISIDAREE